MSSPIPDPIAAGLAAGWQVSDASTLHADRTLEADVVIIAFGFSPTLPEWLSSQGVEASSNGRIIAGGAARLPFQTHNAKLFAGGDAVRGADLVVTAVAEGRDAAESIVALLKR